MSITVEKAESMSLPVIALRGIVVFPVLPVSIEISRKPSISACEYAIRSGSRLFAVAQKDIANEKPAPDELFTVGTVVKIKQHIKTVEGNLRLILEGESRAVATEYKKRNQMLFAEVVTKEITVSADGGIKGEALALEALNCFERIAALIPAVTEDIKLVAKGIKDPGALADFIASNALIRFEDKQQVLEATDPYKRLELAAFLMEREKDLLECELNIHKRVRERIERNQRDYYLREELRVIQSELGENEPQAEEDEYFDRIARAKLPTEVREKLNKEAQRLAATPFGAAEGTVLRNYLDTCLSLPWLKESPERTDIAEARKILDKDHDGLEKVKERILEYLAVRQFTPNLNNQILCLVGPPGVGKTSIAISIARALKRKYVRAALGGIRDEADIRGHRKTYVGAMPGRIIDAVSRAGVRNPVLLLDEIDKLTRDTHGDPSSALLEVLDSEQNKFFRDHFIELPFDLSGCMFIATANTLDTIPPALRDRMEIIELKSYSRTEKLRIAKNHLIPKQLKKHALTKRRLNITDDAILALTDLYTREAGVRNLEREIASLCRKAVKETIETGSAKITINAANISKYLGPSKILPEIAFDSDPVGVVNGLAYTEYGGEMLRIEVSTMNGTGKIELTGSLGDVMQESAKLAVSYVRSKASYFGISPDFYKNTDIHIHAPEGAVPKDGPSAGVAMATAIVSALTGRAIRRDVAMTGELSLRGNVIEIGGLREKTMAAWREGISTVIIPKRNDKDLEDVDAEVKASINFVAVSDILEVLEFALLPAEEPKKNPDLPLLNSILQDKCQNVTYISAPRNDSTNNYIN